MIHIVIGTRAQLFKMAPVMIECQKRKLNWRWIYTAQHKETVQQTLDTFGLPDPDYVVVKWSSEAKTMGKMGKWALKMVPALFQGRKILAGHTGKKNIVITHGDTITTIWAALLGKIYRCRVMHVEAGMRSHKLFEPFPEEISRIVTGWMSDYHMCPDQVSVDNLKKRGGVKVNLGFNTLADTINFGLKHSDKAEFELPKNKYAVASIHRYENIFKVERFRHIIDLLEKVCEEYPLYMPQHPATKAQLEKLPDLKERLEKNPKIHLLPRLEYLPFIKLIKHSEFVITDGGGNQEELYFMGKPTLLFRHATERPEHIGKTVSLSELKEEKVMDFLKNYSKYRRPGIKVKKSPSGIVADHLIKFS